MIHHKILYHFSRGSSNNYYIAKLTWSHSCITYLRRKHSQGAEAFWFLFWVRQKACIRTGSCVSAHPQNSLSNEIGDEEKLNRGRVWWKIRALQLTWRTLHWHFAVELIVHCLLVPRRLLALQGSVVWFTVSLLLVFFVVRLKCFVI